MAVIGLLAICVSNARAGLTTVNFQSNYSQHHLAQFDGVATYDSDTGKLNIAINNTTASGHGGFLTGIALSASGPTLSLENSPTGFSDARNKKGVVKAGPLGKYHGGATTGETWSNGKQAAHGIAAGGSRVLTFDVTGSNASTFIVADFLTPGKRGEEIVASFKKLQHHHADHSGGVQSGPVGQLFASQFDPVSEGGLLPLETAILAGGPTISTNVSSVPLPSTAWMIVFTLGFAAMLRPVRRRLHF
jgi:hypothetical protein